MEEEPEPTKPQSERLSKFLRALSDSQMLVSVATLVISLALAYFSFVQADASRKMQQSQTWPYVSYGTSDASPDWKAGITLSLSNDGVGPARLEEMEFLYRGKPVTSPRQFMHDCCAGDSHFAFMSSPVTGVLRPGETRDFIQLPKSDGNTGIWARLDTERWNVVVRTCYCSIFGDCWVFDGQKGRPEPAKICPADWTRFEERPNQRAVRS